MDKVNEVVLNRRLLLGICGRPPRQGEDTTLQSIPMTNPYRDLPAIDHLLADAQVAALAAQHGHDAIVAIARTVLDDYRA